MQFARLNNFKRSDGSAAENEISATRSVAVGRTACDLHLIKRTHAIKEKMEGNLRFAIRRIQTLRNCLICRPGLIREAENTGTGRGSSSCIYTPSIRNVQFSPRSCGENPPVGFIASVRFIRLRPQIRIRYRRRNYERLEGERIAVSVMQNENEASRRVGKE